MKLHELFEAVHFPTNLPSQYWGGWLHASGNFYPVNNQDGHFPVALQHWKEFGLNGPSHKHEGPATWDTMFGAGWIRVLFATYEDHSGIEFDGFAQHIKAALKRVHPFIWEGIKDGGIEYIHLELEDQADEESFDFVTDPADRRRYNSWVRS